MECPGSWWVLLVHLQLSTGPTRETRLADKFRSAWAHLDHRAVPAGQQSNGLGRGEQPLISQRGKAVRPVLQEGILFTAISQHLLEGNHLFIILHLEGMP